MRNRCPVVATVVIATAAAAIVASRFLPRGNLIEQAKAVRVDRRFLWWENAREIRLYRSDHEDEVLDIESGRSRMTRTPLGFPDRPIFANSFWQMASSDGKWLLGTEREAGVLNSVVRRTDGSLKVRTVPWANGEWLLGRHEISCRWFRNCLGYGVVSCRNGRWTYAEYGLADKLPYRIANIDHLVSGRNGEMGLTLMGFTERGEPVISRKCRGQMYTSYPVDVVTLDRSARSILRVIPFQPPSGMDLPEQILTRKAAFAPKGDRIAWLLTGKRASRLIPDWCCRFLGIPHPEPERLAGIWTTNIDGTHWRCIGTMPATDSESTGGIWGVSWSPDGKRLLFNHNNQWYVIAV